MITVMLILKCVYSIAPAWLMPCRQGFWDFGISKLKPRLGF